MYNFLFITQEEDRVRDKETSKLYDVSLELGLAKAQICNERKQRK